MVFQNRFKWPLCQFYMCETHLTDSGNCSMVASTGTRGIRYGNALVLLELGAIKELWGGKIGVRCWTIDELKISLKGTASWRTCCRSVLFELWQMPQLAKSAVQNCSRWTPTKLRMVTEEDGVRWCILSWKRGHSHSERQRRVTKI